MRGRLQVVPDARTLARAAADEFLRIGQEALGARDRFAVSLAGGGTPRAAYERIAATWRAGPGDPFDWSRVHFFWGDERHVPPEDPRSNYRMARETLLDRVPVPRANIHPVDTSLPDPGESAARYAARLRELFRLEAGALPRFDLVLLGMGADGHVASLFPGSDLLDERERLAAATPGPDVWRVTLTLPVLNNAANVVVLVSGAEKAAALRRAIEGPDGAPPLPAQRLDPASGTLLWLADQDAAPFAAGSAAPSTP